MPGRCRSAFQVVAIVVVALLLWLGWLRLPEMVSRWAFATLETEWGLAGRVDQINLNLATLRLDVRGLSLAAVGTVDQPFLTVGAAVVDLPWSVVLGTRAVDLIDIVAPVVTIRQSAAGVSNLPVLPSAAPAPSNPSEPWRLSVVSVEGAMVSWVDAAQGLSVATGPVGLQLRPAEDGGSETAGRLTVSSPTRVTANTRETSIEPLDLSLTLAPSALTIDGFVASAPEGRLEAAGELVFGPSTPAIGLEYAFDMALARLALWSDGAVELSGDLRVAGRLDGSPASPHISVWLQGDRVGWNGLELADLAMSLTFDGGRLTVEEARAGLAGGCRRGDGGCHADRRGDDRRPAAFMDRPEHRAAAGGCVAGPACRDRVEAGRHSRSLVVRARTARPRGGGGGSPRRSSGGRHACGWALALRDWGRRVAVGGERAVGRCRRPDGRPDGCHAGGVVRHAHRVDRRGSPGGDA